METVTQMLTPSIVWTDASSVCEADESMTVAALIPRLLAVTVAIPMRPYHALLSPILNARKS